MPARKQRSTTSMTHAFDSDYDKVLKQAKRIHRYEGIFYIGLIKNYYSSYNESDLKIYPGTKVSEKWIFQNNRWRKEEVKSQ